MEEGGTLGDHLDDPHAGGPGAHNHNALLPQGRQGQPPHLHGPVQSRQRRRCRALPPRHHTTLLPPDSGTV